MSLFGDVQQIERDQRQTLATVTHLAADMTAGFGMIKGGQDRQSEAITELLLQLENIANSAAAEAAGTQTLIERMQELIEIVRGPNVVGIGIEPGPPTTRP